jgi:subtilisin family serine protease
MRYKLKLFDALSFRRALSLLAPFSGVVSSEAGLFVSVVVPPSPFRKDYLNALRRIAVAFGAVLRPDFYYAPEASFPGIGENLADDLVLAIANAFEVLGLLAIKPTVRGEGIVLAIVDCGLDAVNAGITIDRQRDWWPTGDVNAWKSAACTHGTNVAAVAAALAPATQVIACRTDLSDGELAAFYDNSLIPRAMRGEKIVAVNSWGWDRKTRPVLPKNAEMPAALTRAVNSGILIVFSAGNNHNISKPKDCTPSTIWHFKLRTDVLSIGAWNNSTSAVWNYSSRGPGLLSLSPRRTKPDVVVPLSASSLGTSLACPQAAAVAALVWSANPALSAMRVHEIICSEADDHYYVGDECEGCGTINASRAVARAMQITP